MDSLSPALHAARVLARFTQAPIVPVDAALPAEIDGAILLLDEAPTDGILAELAAEHRRVTAIVLWAPGWDEVAAVSALGKYGFEHGSVDILQAPEPGALAVLFATDADAQAAAPALAQRERPFRALAIMPAFNEADVIYHAIGALVADGIDVYLIDHESTDGTADAARPWLGRGLVHIERFPEDAGYSERNRSEIVWRDILRRVQDVSGFVTADWYLFVNADEFREAPWPSTSLADGLREVDELGFSAVNFELFDFRPTDDSFVAGQDPRRFLGHYEPPGRHDVLQIKAWKRQPRPVDLVTHGGHDLLFDGKRVFPVPFILRHYPIRSSEHGRRKVLAERMPRFAAEERAGGWHVQYDKYAGGSDYLHDPATLTAWDGTAVRAELLARGLHELLLAVCLSGADVLRGEVHVGPLTEWLGRRGAAGAPLQAAQQRLVEVAQGARPAPAPELDAVASELSVALEANARIRGDVLTAATLADARDALRLAA